LPNGDDQNVYLAMDGFGRNGRVYREAKSTRNAAIPDKHQIELGASFRT
jgi:hypothetical protein